MACIGHVTAQGERDYWYFGQLAGMKFNGANIQNLSDNAIPRTIVFGIIEGPDNIICASDEEGELMFYSDGHTFKNRLHQNMLNSPTNEYAVWYSQAAIARDPGNPDRYYVFVSILDGIRSRLSYTIVDMSLDNGLGGLDPNNTHVIMANDVGQQLVTARHANGKDTWLISIRAGLYRSYLVTENGVSTTAIGSQEGISFFDGNAANFGLMQVSPNNKFIAAAFPILRKLFLLEFNDLTGTLDLVYEEEELDQSESLGPFTSVEFSPNSKVLYTSYNGAGIQQYDISDPNNIPPRIEVVTGSNYPYLKLGPNGQIYSIQNGEGYIGAIQDPNVIGLGCNYNPNVLNLSGTNLVDLPTFLLPKYPEGISFINICEGEETELNYSTPLRTEDATYTWDLGDGTTAFGENIRHTYLGPGTYTVTVEAFDNENNVLAYTDTREITIYDTPSIVAPDDVNICSENTTIFFSNFNEQVLNGLDPSVFDVKYYFSEEDALLRSNDVLEFIPEIGVLTMWVRVENRLSPNCYDTTTFTINTPEFISIDMPEEYYICEADEGVTITAPDGFSSYSWSNGADTQSITVYQTGRYDLFVEKDFGTFTCSTQTTVTVLTGDEAPIIEEIKVLDWSRNHNSIEVILSENGFYEYSVDGINYQDSPIFTNLPLDDYYVYVRDSRCLRETVSDKLFLLYYDRFFTPNDDGVNDYWRVINAYVEENIDIYVYDRYGKLLSHLKHYDIGWDGTFNGMDMPTSDYWFRVVRENGDVYYGHFTLKR